MKRIITTLCMLMLLTLSARVYAGSPTKAEKRIAYTIKNLKLNDTQKNALTPLLTSYLAEMKAAKKNYNDLKDKYKNDIDKGTLTDKAAQALLQAKFDADNKELRIKIDYLKKFAAVIPVKKVYYCYDLINDKMSKVEGTKSSSKDDDDE